MVGRISARLSFAVELFGSTKVGIAVARHRLRRVSKKTVAWSPAMSCHPPACFPK